METAGGKPRHPGQASTKFNSPAPTPPSHGAGQKGAKMFGDAGERRFIVEQTLLVTHQTVVYALDEKHALQKFKADEVEDEPKPFYEAPAGAKRGAIKVYEGAEQ